MVGIAAFWPALPNISNSIFGAQSDFVEEVWFTGWTSHALVHGLNPFWSNAINVPTGVNLGVNVSAPFLGLLFAPVSLLISPLVAANLILVLAMPISATAAFFVLRKWQVWFPAAAVGGLMYGFSPYMLGQSQGHPFLSFLPLPPLIAFVVVSVFQGRGNPNWLGLGLGLLVTAQYLISAEVTAVVAIFVLAAIVGVAIRYPKRVPRMLQVAARPLVIALGVSAALLAYPVWMLLAGPQHLSGTTFPLSNPFRNDLLSFVVPGPLQRVSFGMHSFRARVLGYNNETEAGGYLGFPMLVLGGFLVWRSRRSRRIQLTVALFVGACLLSLGPYLTRNGVRTQVPLPFLPFGHLPLLDNILPSRFNFAVGSLFAAVIAFGLDELHKNSARPRSHQAVWRQRAERGKLPIVAVLTLFVLVITQLPAWPYPTSPEARLPPALTSVIPGGNPVALTYPYATWLVTEPMFWQAMDGYRFRIIGGYAYIRSSTGTPTIFQPRMHPSDLQQFLASHEGVAVYGPAPPIGPELVGHTRSILSRYHVRLVIVDRSLQGSRPVIQLFTSTLGPPRVSAGQFVMWVSRASAKSQPSSSR